mgnify:FL=1|tara:strand:+ start:459 stop:731 length:273 start_codon:yes stop_codon:yes gene_type:complete
MILTFGVDFLQWLVVDDHHLEKRFDFDDFATALEFVNVVGDICEKQNHHAEINLSWGRVVIKTWSHDVESITKRDYDLAEAIDEVTKNGS